MWAHCLQFGWVLGTRGPDGLKRFADRVRLWIVFRECRRGSSSCGPGLAVAGTLGFPLPSALRTLVCPLGGEKSHQLQSLGLTLEGLLV